MRESRKQFIQPMLELVQRFIFYYLYKKVSVVWFDQVQNIKEKKIISCKMKKEIGGKVIKTAFLQMNSVFFVSKHCENIHSE